MKIAVLGAGRMGRTVIEHLRELRRPADIVACDPNSDTLDSARQQFGIATTTELDSVLRDPAVRLVMVTATNDAHKELAVRSIEAGKAVMCEKPIATTLGDALEMVELAERRGAFLQIGFELRYSKLFARVKQWIDAGLLGRVVNTHCLYTISEYWGPRSWRSLTGPSGGMFAEKLSHYVDLPRWWIGGRVIEVHSFCSPNIIPYFQIRDNYHVSYRFADGATSHLTFMMGPPATFDGDPLVDAVELQKDDGHNLRYLIVGTHGAASTSVFDRAIKRWQFDVKSDRFTSTLVEQHAWPKQEDHFQFHNTTDQTRDIVDRVERNLPPAFRARDAYETMKLTFAAEESADAQRPIRIGA